MQPLVRIRSPRFAASETMASADTAAEAQDMCWVFGFKGCPLHDEKCPKAKQWLGGGRQRFYTERRTRQAVFDHLMNSPWHTGMTSFDALNLAYAADVEGWEIPADESQEDIDKTIEWEDELVTFDDPELKETVNSAQPKGGSKGGGKDSKGGSSQDGKGGKMVAAKKRPAQPAEPGGAPAARQIARLSNNLEQNIKQQTSNAYVFVQAMTKAESALRTAARVSEGAHRTFMDIPNLR